MDTIFPEDKNPDDIIDDYYHNEDGTHYSNHYTNDHSSIITIIITGAYSMYMYKHKCIVMLIFTNWYQAYVMIVIWSGMLV